MGQILRFLGSDPSLTEAIKFGIEKSDTVTAVSNALIEQTYEVIQPDKQIETVYNFIDERIYQKTRCKPFKETI